MFQSSGTEKLAHLSCVARFEEQSVHSITDDTLLVAAGATFTWLPDVAKTAYKSLDIFSKGDILMKRGVEVC